MSEHPLSVIAEINPPLPRHVNDSELVSFVRMTDVKESGGIATSIDVPFGSVKLGFTRFTEGDVIFAKITPCMENGKGALATGLTSGIGCGSTEFHVLRAKGENCSGYIYQVVQSREFRQKAEMNMSGSAGQQRVPSNFFKEYSVYIPVPPEQRRIAEILSTLDEAIAQTEALIAKHQQIKAGLMHDLFTRGVTPNGHLRPIREQAPGLYKESPLGWIPKEWEVKPLGALAEIVSGVTLGAKGEISDGVGVPYLRVANVQDGYFDLTEVKTIHVSQSQFEKLQLRYGDVLMNEGGDFDKLGRGSVWLEEIKPCIHQNHVFRVRPRDSKLRSYYLAFWSQSEMGKKYFVLSSKQSTNLASINSTQLNRFPVALPSSIEQERIEARVAALNGHADSLEQYRAKLHQQKHGLMHDLLTGKVRVKSDSKTLELADG